MIDPVGIPTCVGHASRSRRAVGADAQRATHACHPLVDHAFRYFARGNVPLQPARRPPGPFLRRIYGCERGLVRGRCQVAGVPPTPSAWPVGEVRKTYCPWKVESRCQGERVLSECGAKSGDSGSSGVGQSSGIQMGVELRPTVGHVGAAETDAEAVGRHLGDL